MIPTEVFESVLRSALSPVACWLDDQGVTEIAINGPKEVFVERGGRLQKVEASFRSREALLSAVRVIAQYVGRPLDEAHPILEARLPDGSRVQVVLPPIAPVGPAVSVRRFSKERLTLAKLLKLGALTQDAAETLRVLIECRQNIVIAGGTGSGKTSLLNALSALIPEHERVIVIEDSRELQLQGGHVVQLEARVPDARGKHAVTIRDLFRASLRMRPDRIVVGEIRGGEALDLIQAMTSGHGGCLATVHATYPIDTLNRLETLALMGGVELPLLALRAQLGSAVDLIVQTARMRDGRRRVTHITEVVGVNSETGYCIADLFCSRALRPLSDGSVPIELVATGTVPGCIETIDSHGLRLPPSVDRRGLAPQARTPGAIR